MLTEEGRARTSPAKMRMEWLTGSAGPASRGRPVAPRLTAEGAGKIHNHLHSSDDAAPAATPYCRWDQPGAGTAEEWRRSRARLRCGSGRRSLPCRGGARAEEALASLISPQRRG